ncbi:MAG TPA: hypothetical protein VNX68_12290, partial [Nitrosopumilaceae archaeon]|nr:hypothetical protein [Nitrosopumilaceae archaeon]
KAQSFQVSGDIDASRLQIEKDWVFKDDNERKEALEAFDQAIIDLANEMRRLKAIADNKGGRKIKKPRNIMRHLTPPKKRRK